MKNWGFLFLLISAPGFAEVISVPENCLQQQVTPCLVRSDHRHELTVPELPFRLTLGVNSIIRVDQLGEDLRIEILEGQVWLKNDQQKKITFKLNKIPFSTQELFSARKENKLKVFDIKSFILSEYDLSHKDERDRVIIRADFLSKAEMVSFIAKFFIKKNELTQFLKSIERDWQKEFKTLNDNQTKVFERSIASSENAEKQKQLRKQLEDAELKKVRDLLFYRTFYR